MDVRGTMLRHAELSPGELLGLLRRGAITLAGHRRGRIYGRLDCPSGRRMRREQRVFFADEAEALALGYRPCGRCLPLAYRAWRSEAGRDRRV
jgi:hypothetical protein